MCFVMKRFFSLSQRFFWAAFLMVLGSFPSVHAVDYTIYGGMSMPRSSFADVASTGINVGAKATFPVTKHVSLIGSVDLFRNNSNGTELGVKYGDLSFVNANALNCTSHTSFTNVPVMGHLHFGMKPKDRDLRFWCEGAAGVNIRVMAPERFSYNQPTQYESSLGVDSYSIVSNFDNKATFATLTSMGFTFQSRYSIGFIWYHLGRARMTGVHSVTNHTTGETLRTAFDYGRLKTRVRVMRFAISF